MKPIKFAIALFVFATAVCAQAAPLLNGLALEKQFNENLFIAAVYSDTLANSAGVLLDNSTGRRLEVRILAKSQSARRFRNQWMESIAINNPGSVLSEQADNMVIFANLFQGRFRQGDRLTVDFAPDTGTSSVALNGLALGEIGDRDFFNTLLRAWVGPIPPSTQFREGLLAAGDVPGSLRDTYELLEPSAERIAELTEQLSEEEEEPEQQTAAAPTPTPATPEVAAAVPPPTLASVGSNPETPAAAAASQPEPSRPEPAPRRTPPPQEPEEEEEEEGPLTKDQILARQIYHSQLLRHTFKNIHYPRRAQERGQEGSVRLRVLIDPRGRVKDVQTLQESRYSSLNREAREAVERASPYPATPPQLIRGDYQFSVPITFKLPD